MALIPSLFAVSGAADFKDARRDLAGLFACDMNGNPMPGILRASQDQLVTATTVMAVDIHDFHALAVRQGALLIANNGVERVALDAAPSANSRIDVIWFKQYETEVPFSDASDGPAFGVSKGTAAVTPVAPSTLPTGAVEIARVTIPAGSVSTSTDGVVITQTWLGAATRDGTLTFRTKTQMDAFAAQNGTRAKNLTDGTEYKRISGVWVSQTPMKFSFGAITSNLNVGTVPNPDVVTGIDGLAILASGTRAPIPFHHPNYPNRSVDCSITATGVVTVICGSESPIQSGFVRVWTS